MKRQTFILIIALTLLQGVQAQQLAPQGRRAHFIGCRTDSGWADSVFVHSDDVALYFIVSITSLGYHELYVNNTKVGDYVMQPAVSPLDKRAQRIDYNITEYVHVGDNEIMLWVGQ